ncbi:surfeit locus protein 6-domain-containing protein [Hyaloraphidium curvatum]|nr:surfeit locus protein 6-domain-containing protein [Hyaloraphidium curvatum]
MAELKSRLLAHEAAFSALVEMIPSKHYLSVDGDGDAGGGKYGKNKRKRAQSKKDLAKLAKRAKLDPDAPPPALNNGLAKPAGADVAHDAASAVPGLSSSVVPLNGARPATASELHARLQQKISELRSKRGAREESPAGLVRSKEEILERRAKEKARGKKDKGKSGGSRSAGSAVQSSGASKVASGSLAQRDRPREAAKPRPGGSVDDFSFGKIEGAQHMADQPKKKKKDAKVLLAKAQKRKQHLAEISKSDPEEARAAAEKLSWARAEKKALGAKLTDDVQLLKKSLKRASAEKKRSAKAWAERLDGQKKLAKQAAKTKAENIEKRKEGKGKPGTKGPAKASKPPRPPGRKEAASGSGRGRKANE